jgi:hypothetical protein
MRPKSKTLINVLKLVLDVAWYLNFVLIAIAIYFLGREFATNEYIESSAMVRIPRVAVLDSVPLISNNVKTAELTTNVGSLTFQVRNDWFQKITAFFFLFAIEAFIVSIIYYLRKLFRNFKSDLLFNYDNVRSLRILAMLVALIYVGKAVLYFVVSYTVNSNFSSTNKFTVDYSSDGKELLIAAILYIVAGIFKYGLELKRENEEFV